MKIGITYRLFFSILGATGLAILALLLTMQWSINRGFYQYLGSADKARLEQVIGDLGRDYEKHGNWNFLKTSPPRGEAVPPMPPPVYEEGDHQLSEQEKDKIGRRPPMPPPPFKRGPGGSPLIILNAEKKPVLGAYPPDEEVSFQPIVVQNETVGYAGLLSPKHFLNRIQMHFLSEQKLSLAIAAACMVVVVMVISFPLARRLVRPIREIAGATHDIASGTYTTRIPVSSADELGLLARDFNEMAVMLEKHEKERRQWVADISHELRTPVAVLRGEIEAVLDGIRTTSPETIRSLHAEVLRLNRLVDDLYQLSLSDIGAMTYRKERIEIVSLLRESLEGYRAEFDRKHITLTAAVPEGNEVLIYADRERLNQLFANLIENSLRYTDVGGKLTVDLRTGAGSVTIEFQDSTPGVQDRDLARLFDRLYRVEESRSRSFGGAGLGLAICKNIVDAHGGSISAHHAPLGGLLISIELPIAGTHS